MNVCVVCGVWCVVCGVWVCGVRCVGVRYAVRGRVGVGVCICVWARAGVCVGSFFCLLFFLTSLEFFLGGFFVLVYIF